jgi:hypothetical protein
MQVSNFRKLPKGFMRRASICRAGVLILSIFLSAAEAQNYEPCEKYEYAELKSLTQKQLQEEYCSVEHRTNDIYRVIGYATVDGGDTDRAVRDRNDCWQAAEKINRQPRAKNLTKDCPGLVRLDPLGAALERSRAKLKERGL